jgi:hypothetical protein
MNNTVWIESIRTEKKQIDTNNIKLPHAETYGEFWNIMTNQTKNAIYTPVKDLNEITIIPDIGNNQDTPEGNKYAIQKTQQTSSGAMEIQLCYITGKSKIENFLARYIRHDILHYKEMVQISIQEDWEKTETLLFTQQELITLANQVTNFEYNEQWVKEYFTKANELYKDIKKDYDSLLKEINSRQKKRNNPVLLEKNMLKLLAHKHTKDTRNMNQLDRTINNLGKEYKKEINEDTWKQNTKSSMLQLLYYRDQVNKMSSSLRSEPAQKNFVDNPDLYMDIPIESSQDAIMIEKIYTEMAVERLLMNNALAQGNLKKIKDQHWQNFYDYLYKAITEWTKEQFKPSIEQQIAFNDIRETYPELNKYMQDFDGTSDTQIENNNEKWQEISYNPANIEQYRQQGGGLFDKITPGPLTDLIDKSNLEPQTKERLKTVSGLAFLIWAGVLVWKTVKGARKVVSWKAESEDRGRLAAGAALFGGAYVSSGNILNFKSLWKDIGSRFSSNPEKVAGASVDAPPEQQIANGFNRINILFGWLKYGLIKDVVEEKNGIMQLNHDKFEMILRTNPHIKDIEERKKLLENIKNTQNPKLFHLAMTTIWLDYETLTDPNKANTTFDETATIALTHFTQVAWYMKEKSYDHRNKELTNKIQEFIRTGKPSLEILDKLWAFERTQAPNENEKLKWQIQSLQNIDENEKENLYYYIRRVESELNTEINIKENNNTISIETYGESTIINPKRYEISNTVNIIQLQSSYEMIKAANLTNRLKNILQKKSNSEKPFNISTNWHLEFENREILSRERLKIWKPEAFQDLFDTRVESKQTLKDITPTIGENNTTKQTYATFLNDLNIRKK